MGHMRYTVENRISHIDIRGRHVNLSTKHFLPVLINAVLHILKKLQVLLHRAVPVRALLSRLCQRPTILTDLVRRQITDIGFTLADQLQRALVHHIKII